MFWRSFITYGIAPKNSVLPFSWWYDRYFNRNFFLKCSRRILKIERKKINVTKLVLKEECWTIKRTFFSRDHKALNLSKWFSLFHVQKQIKLFFLERIYLEALALIWKSLYFSSFHVSERRKQRILYACMVGIFFF